jgi:hypothetical protein
MSEEKEKKRDEALVERLMRRVLEGVGSVVDRKLGREAGPEAGFTTSKLIERMKRLIDERARTDAEGRGIAPHLFKLKVEWGTASEAPREYLKELENEVLAAAIDYVNDRRLRTLAPIKVETGADIFTSGITVDPTYGEFEEELKRREESARVKEEMRDAVPKSQTSPDVHLLARVTMPERSFDKPLTFRPGGRRVNVGRAADNDLQLEHPSVSKVHAVLVMSREGTLLVADTGSTNGTFINGRRIFYGESRQVEEGDVVSFGDVEVRFKRT